MKAYIKFNSKFFVPSRYDLMKALEKHGYDFVSFLWYNNDDVFIVSGENISYESIINEISEYLRSKFYPLYVPYYELKIEIK